MSNSEELAKGTQRGRIARIEALEAKIRESKKIDLEELYGYALRTLNVSKRIVDDYLEEIVLRGSVEKVSEWADDKQFGSPFGVEKVYFVWSGGK